MASHHFIGTGRLSSWLMSNAADSAIIVNDVRRHVTTCGLTVVAEKAVAYDNGGSTFAWILAESHLVLHVWMDEGFATVDLHICDYKASNADKARRLVGRLARRFFEPQTETWRELVVEHPQPLAAGV
jgi:S-adenosylmethionine/arginine decarboxylase-like enzyme